MADALVVGYGNDLRRDDGAGRWVADRVEAFGLAGVDVRSVSQLTPELALDAAGRDLLVFVDADIDAKAVRVQPLAPLDPTPTALTHHTAPASLLAVVPAVGEPPAEAYVVSVPAADLGMGTELSPSTEAAAAAAVDRVLTLLIERQK